MEMNGKNLLELQVRSFNISNNNFKNDRLDLIVSHAGAGSCLEALEYGRRLLGMGFISYRYRNV